MIQIDNKLNIGLICKNIVNKYLKEHQGLVVTMKRSVTEDLGNSTIIMVNFNVILIEFL